MAENDFENLDLACAKCGKEIGENPSKELYKKVTDALSVLTDQGLYAFFLFLDSDSKGNHSRTIKRPILNFLQKEPQCKPLINDNSDVFKEIAQLGQNIDNLILANELVQQTLIYARYHAKPEKK